MMAKAEVTLGEIHKEFRCGVCGTEFRLRMEVPGTGTALGPLPQLLVEYCSHGESVMPGGVPISLEEKRNGKWVEIRRY